MGEDGTHELQLGHQGMPEATVALQSPQWYWACSLAKVMIFVAALD